MYSMLCTAYVQHIMLSQCYVVWQARPGREWVSLSDTQTPTDVQSPVSDGSIDTSTILLLSHW
jgi:hypothetical protein